MEYQLVLTEQEANYILSLLGERPHKEVWKLIEKIKAQGDAQDASKDKPECA